MRTVESHLFVRTLIIEGLIPKGYICTRHVHLHIANLMLYILAAFKLENIFPKPYIKCESLPLRSKQVKLQASNHGTPFPITPAANHNYFRMKLMYYQ